MPDSGSCAATTGTAGFVGAFRKVLGVGRRRGKPSRGKAASRTRAAATTEVPRNGREASGGPWVEILEKVPPARLHTGVRAHSAALLNKNKTKQQTTNKPAPRPCARRGIVPCLEATDPHLGVGQFPADPGSGWGQGTRGPRSPHLGSHFSKSGQGLLTMSPSWGVWDWGISGLLGGDPFQA